jgi:NADH-ubiquinone oxidoreductase chain 2
LIIGSILGLTQFRIKRLYAYSTISHIGFILLALSINSVESIESFIFYLLQYTISNLNAFIILVAIGFSLYTYTYEGNNKNEGGEEREKFIDRNNSPIQLISQVKGYFYVNSFIAISFAITIFSFIGIPPVIGFFAKQMILSAALDSGYIFMSVIAILTSVIGAGYYLNLIKQIFFLKMDYKLNPSISNIKLTGYIVPYSLSDRNIDLLNLRKKVFFQGRDISINSALSSAISVITLLLILFIFMPEEWYNIIAILALVQFKA